LKSRIVLIFVGILGLWALLIFRAGYLQFLPNDRLKSLQSRQFQTKITLSARRGAIVDRNGRDLAMSATAYSLYADPKILENRKGIAKRLAKVLGQPTDFVFSKIKDGNRRFVWIQRMLEQAKADEIKSWKIRGLSFVEEWRRVYPNENLMGQTLGFLGSEGQGLEGIELSYNQALEGNQKKVMVKKDARGRPLIQDGLLFIENPEGHELKLTFDSELQYRLESELVSAVETFEAENAVGVILDAKTSAVLALASVPTFDVNKAMKISPEVRRNRIITDAFEPGSTMKAFVIASALRDGLIKPNTKFYCEKGSFRVGDRIIREAETKEKFENLTVAEILAVSSNVGTSKIALKMGAEKLRQGLLDFGFSQKTGVDLPGEAKGILNSLPWRPHLLSNISFGHGIAVTPLQIANAFAAIANGGVLNTPFVVQSLQDIETGETIETVVKPIRRVLTSGQAAQMRAMLMGVTEAGGTGINARVDGFMVGGKTGTAQKVNPNGRGYLPGAYISSFGGFIPANDPKFVIFVAVDSPKKSYYGSTVAAPLFSRLASYAVRKEGIAPMNLAYSQDKSLRTQKQNVKPKPVLPKSPEVVAEEIMAEHNVPNVMNLTMREVLRVVSSQEIRVKFVGQGKVAEVSPAVGEVLPENREITVILK
jgi:cell division protein FtsI (penicillin-binding protein 3)